MTSWTPKDTARLRGHFGLREDTMQDTLDDADFVGRAAARIEALEARVAGLEAPAGYAGLGSHASDLRELRACQDRIATLEAELADTIPRAVLVSALRERAADTQAAWDPAHEAISHLADEIERGEWPGEGER